MNEHHKEERFQQETRNNQQNTSKYHENFIVTNSWSMIQKTEMKQLNQRLPNFYNQIKQLESLSQDNVATTVTISTNETGSDSNINAIQFNVCTMRYALLIKYKNIVLIDRKDQIQLFLNQHLEMESNQKCSYVWTIR